MVDELAPDVAVIQECGKPTAETDQLLWFGDNPRQGIAVQATGLYRLRAISQRPEVPPYVIPVEVSGPIPFTLMAVWSKRHPEYPYVEGIVRAIELYRDLFATTSMVVAGDFNSNAIWDAEHPRERNHSALVVQLAELGLVSSYHHFHSEEHGAESRPTYFFHWDQFRPFHIDYCFVPRAWASRLARVDIGAYANWKGRSDHRPLLVQVDE